MVDFEIDDEGDVGRENDDKDVVRCGSETLER